ncbi:hypothetical protein QBC46DRAFT_408994 [Diplogelasinospora grovesii]|uniref:Uncharacterized protein n=1 Tax=Diplogelasinospora grovesii TaxID=303347 RepID=A0AAN6N5R1_9PEZI|nr:hypothetical protein QBC46DRAFT_408994 [Diplogelasinospora grovesii]
MAEVENTAEESLRANSLQRMLELEKKYKLERLQNAPASPPSSPPPDACQDRPSLQIRRADSLSQQQNYLMLKAVRRSVAVPSLSITIPQPDGDRQDNASRDKRAERESEEHHVVDGKMVPEPLQKQVKFLAPDDDEEEMSDQSSICQSPSWEGYGQRKKDKKKEAERRKKEREQADKEAKAAKRKLAARLSKSPPPATNGRTSRAFALANGERSMSDPLLVSHLLRENQFTEAPEEIHRVASTSNLPYRPAVDEILSDSELQGRRFVGGIKLEQEREAALQGSIHSSQSSPSALQFNLSISPEPRQQIRKAYSAGPGQSMAPPAVPNLGNGSPREAFPPSSSRTPMLRHTTAPLQGRSNGLLSKRRDADASSNSTHSEESNERGRQRGGYVRQQREQSADRALTGFAYEQMVANPSLNSSSTRSSSRNTQHTRRSSLTQEAKGLAMKLAGLKTATAATKGDTARHTRTDSQTDYFTFMQQAYSTPGLDMLSMGITFPVSRKKQKRQTPAIDQAPASGAPPSRGTAHTSQSQDVAQAQDRPVTAPGLGSSKEPSIGGSGVSYQTKKARSLKDAAKAAFTIHRGPLPTTDVPKSPLAVPPYLMLRTRMQSQPVVPTTNEMSSLEPAALPPASETSADSSKVTRAPEESSVSNNKMQSASTQTDSSDPIKTTNLETQPGSRVSEGSSSSSAYEDGSPLPSPATTPDTSRPQSSRGLTMTVGEVSKSTVESHMIQDDERTLRQSLQGSKSSSTSSTPRELDILEVRESHEMTEEDRWSRTALPLDIDFEAPDFAVSLSNLGHQLGSLESELAETSGGAQPTMEEERSGDKREQTAHTRPETHEHVRTERHQPQLSKSFSNPDLGTESSEKTGDIGLVQQDMAIPPRSKKRVQAANRPKISAGDTLSSEEEQERERQQAQQSTQRRVDEPVDKEMKREILAEKARERDESTMTRESEQNDRETLQRREAKRERKARKEQRKQEKSREPHDAQGKEEAPEPTPSSMSRSLASSSISSSNSSLLSSKFQSPMEGFVPSAEFTSSPYFVDFPNPTRMQAATSSMAEPVKASSATHTVTERSATAPVPSNAPQAPIKPQAQPRTLSAPVGILKNTTRSTSPPAASLLASATRPPVLSALPKHMQLQAGMPVRPPVPVGESRMVPIAKMFVECCNCKFYHDMPSKLYECMAKPDAVVEDKLLGISGAITTMVKCPWCTHNMSTKCCAGYAAVVYLKERLH